MSRPEYVTCVIHTFVNKDHPLYRKAWCGQYESVAGFCFASVGAASTKV